MGDKANSTLGAQGYIFFRMESLVRSVKTNKQKQVTEVLLGCQRNLTEVGHNIEYAL